ncbi:MAG: cobalamin biosynthesis protein CbiX [Burkholderiales bacterium]|nr:cobalamin biosynthesis protein CbiX [Burkholderiales bacterium]
MDATTGLIVFGHGAREPRWRQPFDRLLSMLGERCPGPVSLAFLDSMSPDLITACQDLVARGANRIVVVPAFLGTGGHVRHDLPQLISAAGTRVCVPITMVGSVGDDQQVLAAMVDYCLRSLE